MSKRKKLKKQMQTDWVGRVNNKELERIEDEFEREFEKKGNREKIRKRRYSYDIYLDE